MKLYVVMLCYGKFSHTTGDFSLLGVFDSLNKAQAWIKNRYKTIFSTFGKPWNDELLSDDGYGPFEDFLGIMMKYEIYERWLNEEADNGTNNV